MSDCIFCRIVRREAPSWKVYENESVYTFLDIHPVSEYHTLVVPKRHCENIFDVPEADLNAVMGAVRLLAGLYREKLGIENVQIFTNSGAEAQQDVFHFHVHIVPRKRGDGQNVRWRTYPELVMEFDRMLERLE